MIIILLKSTVFVENDVDDVCNTRNNGGLTEIKRGRRRDDIYFSQL